MFKTLKKWLFDPRVIQLEKDLQIQGVDLHTLRQHAQGQAEDLKAMGMTNVALHGRIDEIETLNKRQYQTMKELRVELDKAKQRNRDYITENEHLLENLEKAENLIIKVKGDADKNKPKPKKRKSPELVIKSNNSVEKNPLKQRFDRQVLSINALAASIGYSWKTVHYVLKGGSLSIRMSKSFDHFFGLEEGTTFNEYCNFKKNKSWAKK